MTNDRDRLKRTFDSVAGSYQQARPEYPEALYDALVELAGLRAGDRLLEIGCATGKATLPLARRGFAMTCLEIGPALAGEARKNLAGFPDVEVIGDAFETWRPGAERFDLVFAAASWHWLDPATRCRRAWELLRPGAHLAFWSTTPVFPEGGDRFFFEIQEVYDELGEGPAAGPTWPAPGEVPDARDELEGGGLFDDVVVRHLDWEVSYSADEYLALLDTFSGHIAMEPGKRERLYGEIRRRLAKRPDGRVRRQWAAVLHVARRAGGSQCPEQESNLRPTP